MQEVMMSELETITVRPDFEVPRMARGNWQIADDHSDKEFDQNQINEDMAKYVDAGITTFVCGDIYAGVEERIGNFRDYYRNLRGEEAANKIKVFTTYVPYFLDEERTKNHSKQDVEEIVNRSLKRLKQDRLDLVQMHWWNYDLPGCLEMGLWLQELQKEGKIHLLAATNFDVPHMKEFFDAGLDVATHTVQYSLLDRRPRHGMVELCKEHDCYLLCYGVLAGGLMSEKWRDMPDPGKPNFENVSMDKYYRIINDFGGWALFQELLDVLHGIANKHKLSIGNIACRYVLDQEQVGAIIIGARDTKHLQDNLRVFSFNLDEDDYNQISQVLEKSSGPLGDCYEIDRDEDRDALEEVKTEYFDIENGKLVEKVRGPVILTGDAAYGHHLTHGQNK
jgi:aryl-alcohol dehydrogenase-like predicted oxidoreductase